MVWAKFGAVFCAMLALAHGNGNAGVDTDNHQEKDSEMVLLVSLSRHGSRAPNAIAKKLCPNNLPNMKSYLVPPEQLTERGMQQLEATGRHIRDVYVNEKKFLSPSFNGDDHSHFEAYFRADSANRCGQSALAMGYGLYPDGTGPAGFAKQPIPVYMQLAENERDFTANGPCWSTMMKDLHHYTDTRGKELLHQHKHALNKAAEICGNDFFDGKSENPIFAIKDVADMFLFDQDEGLPPTPGLSSDLTHELSQLSFTHLIERLYATPRQITYAIGGFPQLLLRNLNDATQANRDPAKTFKYISYHGHRELLHGLGFMMGMKFHFDGLPSYNGSTSLHPGTTLFFELHRRSSSAATTTPEQDPHHASSPYFLRLYVWSPQTTRHAIKLDNCDWDCPLDTFNSIIQAHLHQTGTWQDICQSHPTALKAQPLAFRGPTTAPASPSSVSASTAQDHTNASHTWQTVLQAGSCIVVGAVGMTFYQQYQRRRQYVTLT